MNVIFLDIDGVLNCQVFYEKTVKEAKKSLKKEVKRNAIDRMLFYKKQIDPERITWLNHLCTETNSVVVISSTWRKGNTFEELKNILAFCGATFKIIDVTPSLPCRVRGCEIHDWWSKNGQTFSNYVIIDDDSDMLLNQTEHFFLTDSYSGLTPNTCYKIKNYLNK